MERIILVLFLGLFFLNFEGVAQEETPEKDPYAEYKYLWESDETPKERRKRLKKEQKEKEKQEKLRQKLQQQDTLIDQQTRPVIDSTSLRDVAPLSGDTLAPESSPDSLRQADQAEDVPTDSLTEDSQLPAGEPADSLEIEYDQPEEQYYDDPFEEGGDEVTEQEAPAEEEEDKKKKEKPVKEKKPFETKPINDFRTQNQPVNTGNTINGGFTYTQIGDEAFVGLTLSPELRIWKIGVGLDIPVLFSLEDQTFRDEIYKDGVGAARLIRYLSYGQQKKDQIYFKAGQLDNVMIGFGGLVNNYTNSVSFEKRKLGLHYDFHYKGLIGVEGMYSDFNPESQNLLVTRPYIRPLSFTPFPIINTLEVGATFLSDRDQTQIATSDSTSATYQFTEGGISAFGIDAGITLLRIPFIQIDAFFNYSKLELADGGLQTFINSSEFSGSPDELDDGYQAGTGISFGTNFRFNFIADVLATDVRIERLTYTEHYIPQFFDVSYELSKDARILSTVSAPEMSGIYGSLTGHILKKVTLGGSLLLPDDVGPDAPAVVRVNADVHRLADKFSLHGTYLKGNLNSLSDAFTLDERSVAKVRFIYHLNKILAAGVDYYWAFTPTPDGSYQATRYISPYFGLSISF